MASPRVSLFLLVSLVFFTTLSAADSLYATGLSESFYDTSCPQAASIVDAFVTKYLQKDRNFAGAFNRLQFHDCWVEGCDGSVLLNSTATSQAEREAHVNFGLRDTDPAMDKEFSVLLKTLCPQGNRTNTIFIDSTANHFDRLYYKNVLGGRGVFITDSALITDPGSKKVVRSFAKRSSTFFSEFADAMVKMGNLGVLTGTQGEIRRTCQFVN
ncbi:hypothetical protein AXG93_2801s1020 [Marchantia polymorpha subsp. ruderalis]|uniref:Plant heme peroxidase family profile domain-containing protein n=1 Tax=Marchantia polymorpha subsp. ruderalis TaxID=1480154 RepID=A0A176WGX1_MARPO|nr:hypothetical protein AXG93_2801s1020 [Marchantia polymorpha subsp. ruderalis]